jgi:hypothetical protein
VTLLGEVRFERAYYHCAHCHTGHCPRDPRLGLDGSDLSRGATEAAALAGAVSSFAEGAQKVLPKLTGLRLSASTVERASERVGADVGARLAGGQTFGANTAWKWSEDADGQTVAYVSADLTGVGMQGAHAQKADGRMAAVGMVFNAGVPGQARYVCGMTDGLQALSAPLRNQGAQVGMDRARRWVAISDGGSGLEDWLAENFPRVEAVVLDFYHAAEHLCAWVKVLHPGADEEATRAASHAWCHRLKHEGGAVVLEALRAVDVSGRSAPVQEEHRKVLVYFGNQVHRMDYPSYRAKGWLIGSGPVEAACKTVVGQRLKGSGMRWGEAGADAICHLRALFRSEKGQWDAYWHAQAA